MSYKDRMRLLGLASPEDIRRSLEADDVVLLDVRTVSEIEASGKFEKTGHKWFQSTCDLLESQIGKMFPNKKGPIVIYCRSGKRASKAKEILEGKGYTQVLNAGGYEDMVAMGL